MHTDILIIGQGIAGTLLSYELMRAGKSVLIIDGLNKHKASLVASAVINPLIGKNWTLAKDADMLIPAAIKAYSDLESILGTPFLSKKELLIFHQSEKEENNFSEQINSGNKHLTALKSPEIKQLDSIFQLENKIGKVSPVYTVDAAILLEKWQQHLQEQHCFIEDAFNFNALKILGDKIEYKNISADQIVFCEGAVGRNNPFFPGQNFTTNRGDVLLVSIPELSVEHLYQKGIRLVPRNDGLFWCGSNYTWQYDSLLPDENWRRETEHKLKSWLKLPFEISHHLVAERPTTAGQIPILAQHEKHKTVYFFNGLGTRGFSAGHVLAKEMANLMMNFE